MNRLRLFLIAALIPGLAYAQTCVTQSNPVVLKPLKPEDTVPPVQKVLQVNIIKPATIVGQSLFTNERKISVRGNVVSTAGIKLLSVNGSAIPVEENGDFLADLNLSGGENQIHVTAQDMEGAQTEKLILVLCDVSPPSVEIIEPKLKSTKGTYNIEEATSTILMKGKVYDEVGIKEMLVNGVRVNVNADSTFMSPLSFSEGTNDVKVTAIDQTGNRLDTTISIYHSSIPGLLSCKNYAVIIGIDNYGGKWAKLNNAVRDAKAVAEILNKDFQFEEIRALYNEEATRENILTEIENLAKNLTSQDNLFLYYSGHGDFDEQFNRGYWVPIDAKERSVARYISNSQIQEFMYGMKAKHVLLVTDACFAGDIFKGAVESVPFQPNLNYFGKVFALQSRQAMTAGGVTPVLDTGKDGHSWFAYFFLSALTETEGKYFDATQLFDRVRYGVANNAQQLPRLGAVKNTGDAGGEFVFIRK